MTTPGEPDAHRLGDPHSRGSSPSAARVAGKAPFFVRLGHERRLPDCGLDFDRGEPGYFTGAMYVSYALVIPVIALLTLIEHLIVPSWSLFRLVVWLRSSACRSPP